MDGLCQLAAAYRELFAAQGPAGAEKLAVFAQELGGCSFALVERQLAREQGGINNSLLLLRALDRFASTGACEHLGLCLLLLGWPADTAREFMERLAWATTYRAYGRPSWAA